MKLMFAALTLLALISPSFAQQNRTTTEREVLNQPILPEPGNRNLLVRFGDTAQVHFKMPFKGIRLEDQNVVAAEPRSDHLIAFTGLSPGTSRVMLESSDGTQRTWGTVTVYRDQHEVKLFLPPSRQQGGGQGSTGAGGITIINQSGPNVLQTTDSPDFRSVLCNEVGCSQPAQSK
ncbi:pilus assembly protein N-terminal domain-containing protein [Bradyrhizobium stylosanthis]|uniref:pilus assembly protein N-terminal domain-containing protein n=1 Tax=Bradyrhizobium stylosanthis TaxID=1803665 RepID=UPI000A61043D|nr:pilus assembly protein N-terminal domain-containing protein [Bradyrhizobium stylosanthis]